MLSGWDRCLTSPTTQVLFPVASVPAHWPHLMVEMQRWCSEALPQGRHGLHPESLQGWHLHFRWGEVRGYYPCSALFYTGEASPGVLHPDVESWVQERCRPVGTHPEEGYINHPGDGTHLLQGQAEWDGAGQTGEEKALGRPGRDLSVCKGGL